MDNFNDSKALAIEIAKILDKKKAQDVRVLKVENKGKGFRRIRISLEG